MDHLVTATRAAGLPDLPVVRRPASGLPSGTVHLVPVDSR
jgi:hypothetical protein